MSLSNGAILQIRCSYYSYPQLPVLDYTFFLIQLKFHYPSFQWLPYNFCNFLLPLFFKNHLLNIFNYGRTHSSTFSVPANSNVLQEITIHTVGQTTVMISMTSTLKWTLNPDNSTIMFCSPTSNRTISHLSSYPHHFKWKTLLYISGKLELSAGNIITLQCPVLSTPLLLCALSSAYLPQSGFCWTYCQGNWFSPWYHTLWPLIILFLNLLMSLQDSILFLSPFCKNTVTYDLSLLSYRHDISCLWLLLFHSLSRYFNSLLTKFLLSFHSLFSTLIHFHGLKYNLCADNSQVYL